MVQRDIPFVPVTTASWGTRESSCRGIFPFPMNREPKSIAAAADKDRIFDRTLLPTAAGWLKVQHHTRNLAGGMFEEDCEVWDSTGRLVAQSRQLALAPL